MGVQHSWPSDQLEHLKHCPICGSTERQLMYSDLFDNSFGVAPGIWMMWRCEDCSTGYLDPRPDVSSIGDAYRSYYTHSSEPRKSSIFTKLKELIRLGLMRDYLNKAHGFRFPGATPLLFHLRPRMQAHWDHYIRHLPVPPRAGTRILDIGCGNGDFLAAAAALGYRASGLEPDVKAAELCQKRGLEVRTGGLPDTGHADDSFDHVTLYHVLEHLHDPVASIIEIRRILRVGGRLWITQPNVDAFGHEIFGPAWRGLEPPRHLVLLSIKALRRILEDLCFTDIRLMPPPASATSYFQRSLAIQNGLDQDDVSQWSREWGQRAVEADAQATINPERAESMTFVATRLS